MAENKTRMKEHLTGFIDSLMDEEIEHIHTSIREMKAEFSEEIAALRDEVKKSMSEFRREADSKIQECKNGIINLKKENVALTDEQGQMKDEILASAQKSIDAKQKALKTDFDDLVQEVGGKLKSHSSDITLQIRELEKRITHAEKITGLFGNFAADYSSMLKRKSGASRDTKDAEAPQQPNDEASPAPGPASSEEPPEKKPAPKKEPAPQQESSPLPETDESPVEEAFEENFIIPESPKKNTPDTDIQLEEVAEEESAPIYTDESGQQIYRP
ncbi:MAG: hypothetical protein ACQEQV_01455 [Fibrobacterota bacterium]